LLDHPELVQEVHRSYLEAGADIITTATYQASFEGLARHGLSQERARDVLRSAAELARAARGAWQAAHPDASRVPLVAASVGSYGAFLADGSEFRGDYGLDVDALRSFHAPRLAVLAEGVDVLAFETIPSWVEAQAIAALLDADDGPPAWVSFSCANDREICDGTPIERCVSVLAGCRRVQAIGINCTPPNRIEGLLHRLEGWPRALVVYPNSGECFEPDGREWKGRGAATEHLVALAARWRAAGARVIGGCCRTTPALTQALARWRDAESA
jgi:homocysteine S-methyltransferase